MAAMGKTEDLGPELLDDGQQDVEVAGTLPMSMTTFVGRDQELGEIRSLFREGKRLVTLVGIGGIGKTRIALELGFSAGDLGWANVYFVELAPVTSPDLVDGAVLESVGGGSSRSSLQAVVEHLRESTVLLVLDCCEHVLDAALRVAEVLLRRCPSVAILATSRSPLDIEGEVVWPVPPLSMQKRGDASDTGASDCGPAFRRSGQPRPATVQVGRGCRWSGRGDRAQSRRHPPGHRAGRGTGSCSFRRGNRRRAR